MSADGQHQRPILLDPPRNAPAHRFFPRYLADEERLLFYESKPLGDIDVTKLIVQRIGGRKQEITEINDRLGNNFLPASASWMHNDRAILFSVMFWDKPTPNYNLYRYGLDTQSLRCLTRQTTDEQWPDWIEGALSVSPHGKMTTLWGEIKHPSHSQ